MKQYFRDIFSIFGNYKNKRIIENQMAKESFASTYLIGICICISQLIMVISFCLKEGGPFLTDRRTGYFISYISLFIVTAIFLIITRLLKNKFSGSVMLNIRFIYCILFCFWVIAITFFDQMGGNSIVVYSYTLPAIAAIALLKPFHSIFVQVFAFVSVNFIVLSTPAGINNLYANISNGLTIMFISTIIAISHYYSKYKIFTDKIHVQAEYDYIKKVSLTDTLTNIGNRRYIIQEYEYLTKLPHNKAFPIACFLLDIDDFKKFNDRYGHVVGDRCLFEISQAIDSFSKHDSISVCRYGGEEFLVLLKSCPSELAAIKAEELRSLIKSISFKDDDGMVKHVTVSLGIYVHEETIAISLEDMVRRADKALYVAKANGKDQAVFYSE